MPAIRALTKFARGWWIPCYNNDRVITIVACNQHSGTYYGHRTGWNYFAEDAMMKRLLTVDGQAFQARERRHGDDVTPMIFCDAFHNQFMATAFQEWLNGDTWKQWHESLPCNLVLTLHYNDVIMGAIASQITSLTIVYSIVYSDADQIKY